MIDFLTLPLKLVNRYQSFLVWLQLLQILILIGFL
uniref:Uncharacterized protein n=1 Tax=Rhizophora mucronata TaxID=61149 RepID=A0A2P2QMG1_RHIMU